MKNQFLHSERYAPSTPMKNFLNKQRDDIQKAIRKVGLRIVSPSVAEFIKKELNEIGELPMFEDKIQELHFINDDIIIVNKVNGNVLLTSDSTLDWTSK